MNIAVYINSILKEYQALQAEITTLLAQNHFHFKLITEEQLTDWADILIVLGGDGSILKMARLAACLNIKVLAINAGNLGFLAEFEKSNLNEAVQFLKSGKFHLDTRPLLACNVNGVEYLAVNEIVLHADYVYYTHQHCLEDNANDSKVLRATVQLDGQVATNLTASGLLVSTPTGSTAYSLSAGGAVLTPNLPAFIFTPINANSLTSKPIVYDNSSVITIDLQDKSANAILMCDGKNIARLQNSTTIQIYKAKESVTYIRQMESNFFEKLRKKS